MKIAFFSALPVEEPWYELASNHCITYISQPLTLETAELAIGHRAVCAADVYEWERSYFRTNRLRMSC